MLPDTTECTRCIYMSLEQRCQVTRGDYLVLGSRHTSDRILLTRTKWLFILGNSLYEQLLPFDPYQVVFLSWYLVILIIVSWHHTVRLLVALSAGAK
jgi:hypothetical protein